MLKGKKPVIRTDNRFRQARKAAGLTQAGMSKLLEIPKRNIENWEGDKAAPPKWAEKLLMEKLRQIAADRTD